ALRAFHIAFDMYSLVLTPFVLFPVSTKERELDQVKGTGKIVNRVKIVSQKQLISGLNNSGDPLSIFRK
ncbi:MAG: hypothetical protein ACJAS1_007424, partial [Oleiphilaceae bacterium]